MRSFVNFSENAVSEDNHSATAEASTALDAKDYNSLTCGTAERFLADSISKRARMLFETGLESNGSPTFE
ncbi:MAG TPA: hypothetical protein VGB17_10180 [Pyrinomonadaceae bacterium]